MLGGIGGRRRRGRQRMRWLNGITDSMDTEWTPGVGDGQGGLACCDSWGHKKSDMTERLIWSDLIWWLDFATGLFCWNNLRHNREGILLDSPTESKVFLMIFTPSYREEGVVEFSSCIQALENVFFTEAMQLYLKQQLQLKSPPLEFIIIHHHYLKYISFVYS